LNGDILGGSASVVTITEGDWGVSSHRSLKKIKGALFGVGPLGVLVVQNGSLLLNVSEMINPLIRSNDELNLGFASANNDFIDMGYMLSIPPTSSSGGSGLTLFFDYDNQVWSQDTWTDTTLNLAAGYVVNSEERYFASNSSVNNTFTKHVHRILKTNTYFTNLAEIFSDDNAAIPRVIKYLYHLGTPSIDKEFLRLKLFSMYNPGEEDQYVTSTPTIKTYKDFQTSVVDSQFSLPFTSATQFEAVKKLKANKARALEIEIIDSTVHECLHLTGWEIVVEDGFRKEDIV
jgi:hypothetical protein